MESDFHASGRVPKSVPKVPGTWYEISHTFGRVEVRVQRRWRNPATAWIGTIGHKIGLRKYVDKKGRFLR